jgi:hypothetical protein
MKAEGMAVIAASGWRNIPITLIDTGKRYRSRSLILIRQLGVQPESVEWSLARTQELTSGHNERR